MPFAARLCATPRPDWPACKPKAERQHCVMHGSNLGRLYYSITRQEKHPWNASDSCCLAEFQSVLQCGEAAVCAEMTYMMVRRLSKACITSTMHSGRLVFAFPRHLSLLHAATLPCIHTAVVAGGVMNYTQSTFLPLPFSSVCNHTNGFRI